MLTKRVNFTNEVTLSVDFFLLLPNNEPMCVKEKKNHLIHMYIMNNKDLCTCI